MRLKKKQNMMLSFVVGLVMFASTAFAEINSKSGYEQGKDIIKYTAASLNDGTISSYTIDKTLIVKIDGVKTYDQSLHRKYDVVNKAIEESASGGEGANHYQYYSYMDNDMRIDKLDNGYRVSNNQQGSNFYKFNSPLDRGDSSDLEKIVDAAIGQLKDYVIISEKPDGSKEVTATLKEIQIPTEVNAITSYYLKNQNTLIYSQQTPNGKAKSYKEIFIKSVEGKMDVFENGIVNSILASVSILAKDQENNEHIITLEILLKITDIDKTVVQKPNLQDSNIFVQYDNYSDTSEKIDINIYVGTYKSDIDILKDGQIVKIGERIVEIKSVDQASISGVYSETYKEGYESNSRKSVVASFTGEQKSGVIGYGKFYVLSYDLKDKDSENIIGFLNSSDPSNIFFNSNLSNKGNDDLNRGYFRRVVQ